MSHPNTDRDERVADIRIRHKMLKFSFEGQQPPQSLTDIDYLLSLLDSQAGEYDRMLRLYNGAWLWVQQRVKHPNTGQPPAAMTLIEMLPLLCAAMRDRCVAKVRRHLRCEDLDGKLNVCIGKLIPELESLTLEQVEQVK